MKYMESKNRIAKFIVPIIQKLIDDNNITTYIEPFVGGANIIDKITCKTRIGYDVDDIPITLLNEIPKNPQLLDKLPLVLERDEYNRIVKNPTSVDKWYYSAVRLFGSFNNRLYGGCYGGKAITKEGKLRNYFQEGIKNFKKQIPKLNGIIFEQKDYRTIDCENCLLYCDIPYSSGVQYKTRFNTEEFWDWCRKMSLKNIVIVSEYTAPDDFECIWEHQITTSFRIFKTTPVERLFIFKGKKLNRLQFVTS